MDPDKPSFFERISSLLLREPEDREQLMQLLHSAHERKLLDADADPRLEALYGERVPVLLHGETELCHYFMDAGKVRDYLSKIG